MVEQKTTHTRIEAPQCGYVDFRIHPSICRVDNSMNPAFHLQIRRFKSHRFLRHWIRKVYSTENSEEPLCNAYMVAREKLGQKFPPADGPKKF
jgi:glutathionyl-hydroquinone reductase